MSKILIFLKLFNYIIASVLIGTTIYVELSFFNVSFEQLLYTILNTNITGIYSSIKSIVIAVIYIMICFCILFSVNYLYKKFYEYKNNNKFKTLILCKKKYLCNSYFISLILLILSIIYSMYFLGFFSFISDIKSETKIYNDYYVDPQNVEIVFPKQKRNLIYIYLESYENTFLSSENGGTMDVSYIPALETIALENLNFSNNAKIGGASVLTKSAWTIAAMVSQTAGVPLAIPMGNNSYTGYSSFLPGCTSLGDILENNGYKNYLLLGSPASFAGRDNYFKTHGNYEIIDYDKAKKLGKIDKDYFVFWGYEDNKLFEFAKEELLEISKKDEPFNFTMLTVDTHFVDGYLDDSCDDDIFDNQYANVFYCNSNMVYNFIEWIKEQDFYENTTIVLSGDHCTMQNININLDNEQRTTYNAFINTPIEPKNSKNRLFTTLDMFPTTLASLGVEIKGNKLGLGTNLFSDEKTLAEIKGYTYLDEETRKRSSYYNTHFLKDDYYHSLTS